VWGIGSSAFEDVVCKVTCRHANAANRDNEDRMCQTRKATAIRDTGGDLYANELDDDDGGDDDGIILLYLSASSFAYNRAAFRH
jgi:hypothetical protein